MKTMTMIWNICTAISTDMRKAIRTAMKKAARMNIPMPDPMKTGMSMRMGIAIRMRMNTGMSMRTDTATRMPMKTGTGITIIIKIFGILAEAEAKAHGTDPEHVHFHEVGAIDSIVDIVAAAVCFDSLGIRRVFLPVLYEGTGTVRCQHGILPVPVPATANIISAYGLPLSIMHVQGEFVTPTGAAILAAIVTDRSLPDGFMIRRIGMGAGKRTYERPSILRAMEIETAAPASDRAEADSVLKLESNIDDCSGELLGYAMERLLEAGARDVFYMPVQMKKNRPGWLLTVLCSPEDREKLEEIIFRETTTIGIRRTLMERTVLDRSRGTVLTEAGTAEVKICGSGENTRVYPEYESAADLARKSGRSLYEIYRMIRAESGKNE